MKVRDFDYHLPKQLIAQHPADPRDASKLMVVDDGTITHQIFHDLPAHLRAGDLLIVNESRVVPARLFGTKPTGGKIEVLLIRRISDTWYECLVKGRTRVGGQVSFNHGVTGTVVGKEAVHTGYRYTIAFQSNGPLEDHLNDIGILPLPPYIKAQPEDGERYQTVYSSTPGSIAAPTAGLHFTPELLARIRTRGVGLARITLHVGIGTFMPVRAENVEDHIMESEYFVIDNIAADMINRTIEDRGKIFVVGTTSVRALESARWKNGKILPSAGFSDIFIYPPYQFKTPINALITNFHLPGSTLLMLVSAFTGRDMIMNAYREAIDNNYRFYSFGDAMMIMNDKEIIHV